ncbi:hypothetical protein BgiBS90_008261 [Biomphalaria glabrata]|nr:hypothetical protein BgiBS90_008261 [Biomphalaria glabrata]
MATSSVEYFNMGEREEGNNGDGYLHGDCVSKGMRTIDTEIVLSLLIKTVAHTGIVFVDDAVNQTEPNQTMLFGGTLGRKTFVLSTMTLFRQWPVDEEETTPLPLKNCYMSATEIKILELLTCVCENVYIYEL